MDAKEIGDFLFANPEESEDPDFTQTEAEIAQATAATLALPSNPALESDARNPVLAVLEQDIARGGPSPHSSILGGISSDLRAMRAALAGGEESTSSRGPATHANNRHDPTFDEIYSLIPMRLCLETLNFTQSIALPNLSEQEVDFQALEEDIQNANVIPIVGEEFDGEPGDDDDDDEDDDNAEIAVAVVGADPAQEAPEPHQHQAFFCLNASLRNIPISGVTAPTENVNAPISNATATNAMRSVNYAHGPGMPRVPTSGPGMLNAQLFNAHIPNAPWHPTHMPNAPLINTRNHSNVQASNFVNDPVPNMRDLGFIQFPLNGNMRPVPVSTGANYADTALPNVRNFINVSVSNNVTIANPIVTNMGNFVNLPRPHRPNPIIPNVGNLTNFSVPNIGNFTFPNSGSFANASIRNVDDLPTSYSTPTMGDFAYAMASNTGNLADVSFPANVNAPNVGRLPPNFSFPTMGTFATVNPPNVSNSPNSSLPTMGNFTNVTVPNVNNSTNYSVPYAGNFVNVPISNAGHFNVPTPNMTSFANRPTSNMGNFIDIPLSNTGNITNAPLPGLIRGPNVQTQAPTPIQAPNIRYIPSSQAPSFDNPSIRNMHHFANVESPTNGPLQDQVNFSNLQNARSTLERLLRMNLSRLNTDRQFNIPTRFDPEPRRRNIEIPRRVNNFAMRPNSATYRTRRHQSPPLSNPGYTERAIPNNPFMVEREVELRQTAHGIVNWEDIMNGTYGPGVIQAALDALHSLREARRRHANGDPEDDPPAIPSGDFDPNKAVAVPDDSSDSDSDSNPESESQAMTFVITPRIALLPRAMMTDPTRNIKPPVRIKYAYPISNKYLRMRDGRPMPNFPNMRRYANCSEHAQLQGAVGYNDFDEDRENHPPLQSAAFYANRGTQTSPGFYPEANGLNTDTVSNRYYQHEDYNQDEDDSDSD